MSPQAPARPPANDACDEAAGSYHPLELFPFFRRFKPGIGRDILYTFLWNCLLGLLFWTIAIMVNPASANRDTLTWNIIASNSIGYTIHALFAIGELFHLDRRARAAGSVFTALYYTLVSTGGVLIGFALVAAFLAEGTYYNWLKNPRWLMIMAGSSIVVSVILSAIFFLRARQANVEAEAERQRVRAERVEREATLANLRALQAQIEPHFLFNTLANVAGLIDPDPAKAKRMLETFIRFLRASLAATRNETTTLRDEAELISSYLDVLQVRMGPRLRYAIDVPPELHEFRLPPMLLQPVVENAIRHGLEPKMDGGTVSFAARLNGSGVVIDIADSGVGFAPTTHGGIGLTNVRDRLRLVYGGRASLAVGENPGGGARVTLTLPPGG